MNSNGTKGREEAGGEEASGGEESRESASGEEATSGEETPQGLVGEEEEAVEEERRDLQDLHLQSVEASAPRYRNLEQSHGNHEQLHQRHFREACTGSGSSRAIQQEAHHNFSRDSDCCSSRSSWGAREARRF